MSEAQPSSPHVVDEETQITAAPSRALEVGIAVVCIAISVVVLILSYRIELRVEQPGVNPRTWPQILSMLSLGLSFILLIASLTGKPPARDDLDQPTRSGWFKLLLTVGSSIVFIVLWPIVGFLITTPLFIAATTAISGGRGLRALVAYPIVITGGLYALFNLLLRVPL